MKCKNKIDFLMLAFGFVIISLIANSCGYSKETIKNNHNGEQEMHTMLWEIKEISDIDDSSNKNKKNNKLYLLGSVHIGSEDMYPLDTVVVRAFEESDVLGVELNIKKINFSDVLPFFFDLNGDSKNILPPELYNKLEVKFTSYGLPPGIIRKLKPVGIAMLLEILKTSDFEKILSRPEDTDMKSEVMQGLKSATALGIDYYFLELAESLNKTIYELETIDRQIKAFASLENNLVEYLTASLDTTSTYKEKDIKSIITAWKTGDVEKIENLLKSDFSANKKINEHIKNELIYNRNIEMAGKIQNLIKGEKQYFIVVGAGHLVGTGSIIDILQKTGKYEIRRY